MRCSIFIASSTSSSCPRVTVSPGATAIDSTRPGIGAFRAPLNSAAPADGTIGSIQVTEGEQVANGAMLVVLDEQTRQATP
jgi:multidrug efflux pump subunit AcrA (membrane-fusion protein)